jgi:hypothetical protein
VFQFTIRDDLFAFATVGLSIAWWIDHQHLNETIVRLEGEILDLRTENLDLSIRGALAHSTRRGERPTVVSPRE